MDDDGKTPSLSRIFCQQHLLKIKIFAGFVISVGRTR
jgi:hypothetical protein